MLTWIKRHNSDKKLDLTEITNRLTSLDYQGYLSPEATVLLTSELKSS